MRPSAQIFFLVMGLQLGACASSAPPAATPAPAASLPGDRVIVKVTDQGFVPARIPAKRGVPLTLVITREFAKTCATEIQFDGQPGSTALPVGQAIEVTYTPSRSGDVRFGCAMGMMIGGVLAVVE